MPLYRFTKISLKLALIYAGLFSAVLVLLTAAIILGVHFFLMHQAVAQVRNTTEIIIERVEELEGYKQELKAKDLVLEIPSNDNIYVKIFEKNGRTINESAKFNQRIPKHIPVAVNRLKLFRKRFLYETRRIGLRHHDYAYLQVVKNITNERRFLRFLITTSLAADIFGIFCSLFAGLLLSKKMLHPLTQITQAAQNISIHDLNQRLAINGPNDEFTTLAKTFNEMIGRLQNSFQLQNQFVSDASHELRTPISVIQGYINLLDRWGKSDPEVLLEAIDTIKKETAHMAEMIEKLLILARGDNGMYDLKKEEFCLSEMIGEVVKETRLIAKDYTITFDGSQSPVNIYGDRRLLKQMIRAIVDNSLKFSTRQKTIDIALETNSQEAVIKIQDFGIGIPKEELSKIFNRFYQVDKAKNRGNGLGLAIVQSIVQAHSGIIEVESELEKGTTFRITLPVDAPSLLPSNPKQ